MHVYKKIETEYVKNNNKKLVENLRISKLIKDSDDVLDFGCGRGIWNSNSQNKDSFFHELYLYDINPENRKYCKEKYQNFIILNNLEKNFKVDRILINSVIQYIKKEDLEKIFSKFHSMLKKDGIIIILDIPKNSRIIEFILTCFTNFDLFKIQVEQIRNSKYRKTDYYIHSIKELISISEKYFDLTKIKNLDINTNRFGIILKKL